MTDHHDVVVVGAGQAGLAIGYHLARARRRFLILEAADGPAAAWRSRWDSLRLFTPVRYNSLPGLPFPGDPDHHPTRDEVVAYLTAYAERFGLPIQPNRRVTRLRPAERGYRIEAGGATYTADQVVIATGPFQTPRTPAFAAELAPHVDQLHSADYRRPSQIADGPVLVVGGGNTGYQIADELAGTHEVHLAIGSRQTPLPQRLLGRDIFAYLTALGLMRVTADSRLGRRLRRRETLIGSSPRAIRRRGVTLHGRAVAADGGAIVLADGTRVEPRTVIWATGYGRDDAYLEVPVLDRDGRPVHERGVTAAPGLYFLGLSWQHTRGSALLGWVKEDAAYLAARIDALAAAGTTTAPRRPATAEAAR
jgi:putative flavoprotein involved in K+ transport